MNWAISKDVNTIIKKYLSLPKWITSLHTLVTITAVYHGNNNEHILHLVIPGIFGESKIYGVYIKDNIVENEYHSIANGSTYICDINSFMKLKGFRSEHIIFDISKEQQLCSRISDWIKLHDKALIN